MLIAGLIGGWAGYLIDPVSSGDEAEQRKHALKRYLLLGIIASASVPLFLSVLQSALISNIFVPRKDNNVEIVPYTEFLIFVGFCLIAAVSARTFLDTVSHQVLRDVKRIEEKADKATAAIELIDEGVESKPAEPPAAQIEAAKQIAVDAVLPKLTAEEQKTLSALMKRTFRTATGIGQEIGVSRNRIGDLLDELASKAVVERTTSPNTGGPRWRITALGVRVLNANQHR